MSTPTNTGGIVGRGRRTFGDPAGEFNQTVTVEGNYEATGSNDLGWSALVVKTAGDAVLHTHNGSVAAADLSAGVIYPIGIKRVSTSNGKIILLKK